MKSSKKTLAYLASLIGVTTLIIPIITSCSTSKLKIVGRGDGTVFSQYGNDVVTSFKQNEKLALNNETAYKTVKTQIVNQLLYNWYKQFTGEDKGKKITSFADKWKKWEKSVNDDYNKQVQNLKNQHKQDYEYYLQNNVLDPVGGTEKAWKYDQMCQKVRAEFSNLVYNHNYLSYSTDSEINVDSQVGEFNENTFENSLNWKNVGFYARSNISYNPQKADSLDDVYALIQQHAFELWTQQTHPMSVAMSLWKYEAPSEGMRSIYSDRIPDNNSSNNSATSLGDESSKLKETYETPAFAPYVMPKTNATGKYWALMDDMISSKSKMIDNNGFIRIKNASQYTDDNATAMIVNASDAFSTLDVYFAGAVSQLLGNYSGLNSKTNKWNTGKYIQIPIESTIESGKAGATNILGSFFYRSNDTRIYDSNNNNALTPLGQQMKEAGNYVLDLSKAFSAKGKGGTLADNGGSSNFHSHLFKNNSSYEYDWYGDGNYSQYGGIQYILSAVQLKTTNNQVLPMMLIRDTFGVHLVGLNGVLSYNGASKIFEPGFLAKAKSDANNNTEPFSQQRQNLMLLAQSLYQKSASNESGIDINSKIKDFLKDNLDDVILAMANQKTERPREKDKAIFDLSKVVPGDKDKNLLFELLNAGNELYAYEKALKDTDAANKKLYSERIKNVQNSLVARSESAGKVSADNYKNALATPYPFDFVNPVNAGTTTLSTASWNVTSITSWIAKTSYAPYTDTDKWAGPSGIATYTDLSNKQKTFDDKIDQIITQYNLNVANISNEGSMRFSEHLYPVWKEDNALINGVYKALASYLGTSEATTNQVKLYAMKKYAESKDLYIANQVDPITNMIGTDTQIGFKDSTLADAVYSMYYTSKLLTKDTPISYYWQRTGNMSAENYKNLLKTAMKQTKYATFGKNAYSDDAINYWTFIDTLAYFTDNNYAKLIEKLNSNSYFGTGDTYKEADLVWVAQDNIDINPSFKTEKNVNEYFKWQENYDGNYDDRYMPKDSNSETVDTPNSYVSNSSYYVYAPMQYKDENNNVQWNNFAMGFAGLNIDGKTNGAVTSAISDAIFNKTYYSKITKDGNNINHLGGWNKFISIDKVYEYLTSKSGSVSDINEAISQISSNNSDPNFTRIVIDIANRTTFTDGDPELDPQNQKDVPEWSGYKAGDYIPAFIREQRLQGKDYDNKSDHYNPSEHKQINEKVQEIYQNKGWGLKWYETNHNTEIKNLLTKFGDSTSGVQQLFNGDASMDSHLITYSSDTSDKRSRARVAVLQLNREDVKDTTTLLKALGSDSNSTYAKTLLNLIAVQFAMDSANQSNAIDAVKDMFKDKFTVFDRRLNDALGQSWVKDWKSSN